jgi:hypothetical protein
MVIPTTASRASTMIWATAKSTDVSSRQMPRPSRAKASGTADRVSAAGTAAWVAMPGP